MVQKRGTKAINKLCVREILSLSFVCGAYFFEFRGRNLVCFGIEYNFDGERHWQIRAGSREGMHAHCVFHACRSRELCFFSWILHSKQANVVLRSFKVKKGKFQHNYNLTALNS